MFRLMHGRTTAILGASVPQSSLAEDFLQVGVAKRSLCNASHKSQQEAAHLWPESEPCEKSQSSRCCIRKTCLIRPLRLYYVANAELQGLWVANQIDGIDVST